MDLSIWNRFNSTVIAAVVTIVNREKNGFHKRSSINVPPFFFFLKNRPESKESSEEKGMPEVRGYTNRQQGSRRDFPEKRLHDPPMGVNCVEIRAMEEIQKGT